MTDAMLHNFGFRTAYDTGVFSPDYRESTDDAQKYAAIFADCINAPKYGNADPYADQLLRDYHTYLLYYLPTLESFFGKPEYLCQISVSTHGPQGFITLATADGRLAGTHTPTVPYLPLQAQTKTAYMPSLNLRPFTIILRTRMHR